MDKRVDPQFKFSWLNLHQPRRKEKAKPPPEEKVTKVEIVAISDEVFLKLLIGHALEGVLSGGLCTPNADRVYPAREAILSAREVLNQLKEGV